MPPRNYLRRAQLLTAALAMACAGVTGCAGLRCPRIDPSGERCLIWPKDEIVTPVNALPAAAIPPVAGNLQAPPVGTDPFFPSAPAVAAAAPAAAAVPASVSYPQVPQDALSITPGRVLAPVGSEVVLKASICTPDGYTLANQKVEWMLGRNGVGQFVELGGKGVFHPPLIPWNRGEKVDNYLANGYTADGPLCINRGTEDPSDDVNINRGDAWISVTSPNEGTSHVTAYAPAVESWNLRKAAATIYWVDVQWTFPPPTVTSSGRETLTTTVTRQSDGTPLEGWIVRYQVADGSAAGAAIPEVRTGADGRASVQVSPTGGAATSQINVQLVRPANFAGGDAPQLVVGSGTTLISWGGSQPYLPPSTAQPLPTSPAGPAAQTPPIQQNPITPPPSLPTTAARLELDVQVPPQVQVGGSVRTQVTIRNVGDAPATRVKVTDKFDAGLIRAADPSRNEIANDAIGTIGPRESRTVDLELQVSKAGRLCQLFTVEFAEGSPVTKQACVVAAEAAPQREGGLRVTVDGPAVGVQGQTVQFKVTVKNTGQTALLNVVTEEEYPPAVLQVQPELNTPVVSGRITRQVGRLDVGQQRDYYVTCLCLQATRATVLARGRAETDPPTFAIENNDDHSLEIRLAQAQPPIGTAPVQPPAANTLSVVVSLPNPTVLVNARANVQVTVTNKSTVREENVALRVLFPANVTPDPLAVQGPAGLPAPVLRGEELVFDALPSLAPGETALYNIPINPTQSGIVQIIAQAVSANVRQGSSHSAPLEILGNRR